MVWLFRVPYDERQSGLLKRVCQLQVDVGLNLCSELEEACAESRPIIFLLQISYAADRITAAG